MPRVSVVVPVFNAQEYIGETLLAIARQTMTDLEVLVVDDCSTDGSADIIKTQCAADARFSYHRSPSNFGGPAGPRNLGVAASSSDFVAFCDADDLWVPHKLAVQLAVAEATGSTVVSGAICDFCDGDTLPVFEAPTTSPPIRRISHARLLIKNWIALSSVLVRRQALLDVGGFNTARSHVAVEDYDMWLRITQAGGKVVRIGVPLVHYRKLPNSISASKSMMVRKALNVIGEDYARRGRGRAYRLLRPLHWLLYVGSSAWMRAVRHEL